MGVEMEWISVSERVPDGPEEVLVAYENGEVGRDFYSTYSNKFVFKHGGEVTHWMPFPSHPSKEKRKG